MKEIQLQPGTYILEDTLFLPDDVRLVGHTVDDAAAGALEVNADNLSLVDVLNNHGVTGAADVAKGTSPLNGGGGGGHDERNASAN